MKHLTHTLFFFLLTAQICFGQWYPQNSGTTQNLSKVQFVDANTGWAVGDSGLILHTSNGGVDWIQQASGTNLKLVDISFVDANTGWVLASDWHPNYKSILLKTINRGLDWIQQMQDTLLFSAVFFIDENIGWLVGGGIILKTTDGGNIWIPKTPGPGEDEISDVKFLDPFTGFVVGYYWTILKSTDGGDNWIFQMGHSYVGGFDRISFSNLDNGFVIGEGGQAFPSPLLYRTTNGGAEWLYIYPSPFAKYKDIYSINSNIVYIVGLSFSIPQVGTVLKSSDAGTTWDEQLFEIDKAFNGVQFVDENIGWVVGDNGTILHTTNGGVSFVDDETTQPTDFILEQNYPNPFNPSTKISWQSPVGSHQTLKVFDVLGNEIATLVDEYKPAGRYEVEFNAAVLPSGVYFYQLRAGTFVETKKMILIR